jgi:DNA-binding transcriptional ArsR family regulator
MPRASWIDVEPRLHDAAELRAAKALAHPIRTDVLAYLRAHERVSPHELAERWGIPLGTVSYHFRRLHELGFVRLEARTSRRGAIVHHYALDAGADETLRQMAQRALSRPESARTSAHAILDATALAALRADLQRLVARMKELEAQTITRAGATAAPAPALAVELVLAVEHDGAAGALGA